MFRGTLPLNSCITRHMNSNPYGRTGWCSLWIRSSPHLLQPTQVYLNLPGRLSLSTNHLEVGENDRLRRGSRHKADMQSHFTLQLVKSADMDRVGASLHSFPPLENLHYADLWGRPVANATALARLSTDTFDSCVVQLYVKRRAAAFHEIVLYVEQLLATATTVGAVVILWDSPLPLPEQTIFASSASVVVLDVRASGRSALYRPNRHLARDCVVLLDEGWEVPGDELQYACRTWQGHFFNHLVGFAIQGRTHRRVEGATGPWTLDAQNQKAASVVLPAGLVVHRKYFTVSMHALSHAFNQDSVFMGYRSHLVQLSLAH